VTLPFECPPPKGYRSKPVWEGKGFICEDQQMPVLEYSENSSGWTDSMTTLHEEVAWDSHPIDIASRMDALAQIKKILPHSHAVILEIGCSSGFLLKEMVRVFPGAIVMGADVVKEPLYRLSKSLIGVPLFRFDMVQCPLPEKIIDVIVMLNVLEHIEDDVGALKKAYRLLKPGGSLVLEVPAGPRLYDDYDSELHHYRRYSPSDLGAKLNKIGFRVIRKSHLGFLLFPAFALVKLKNKYVPHRKKESIVRSSVSSTLGNGLVRFGLRAESKFLNNLHLPFGIRALFVARREK
jgi:SAM-dependent methyltransferase